VRMARAIERLSEEFGPPNVPARQARWSVERSPRGGAAITFSVGADTDTRTTVVWVVDPDAWVDAGVARLSPRTEGELDDLVSLLQRLRDGERAQDLAVRHGAD
jgi:hypothetical protein